MKKNRHPQDVESDTLRPEYNLSQLVQAGERGKYHKALRKGYTLVVRHKDGTEEMAHFRPLPGTVHLALTCGCTSLILSRSTRRCAGLSPLFRLSGGPRGSRRQRRALMLEPHDVSPLAHTLYTQPLGPLTLTLSRRAARWTHLFV